jgi:hypothetical protein
VAHVGEHAGGWQTAGPPLHTPDAHCVPVAQGVPGPQLGEHPPPPWHLPLLHVPDVQSLPRPQGPPDPHGRHAGSAHVPAVQTPEPQS